MKPCFPESMYMKYTYLFYFLETVFQPIELTRKVTSVPRNFLGAPIYPTPTQYVTPGDIGQPSTSATAKVINPISSTSSNYTYDECNPIPFFRTDFQPTELGYVSEEEGSRSEASPTTCWWASGTMRTNIVIKRQLSKPRKKVFHRGIEIKDDFKLEFL